jgi:hypothetical protein
MMLRSTPFVPRAHAVAIADILATAADLRKATAEALRLRAIADRAQGGALQEAHAARLAEDHVRDLTDRIRGRVERDGLTLGEAIRAAEAVIDGKARLPRGVEPAEGA